jgi:hypothetical protein
MKQYGWISGLLLLLQSLAFAQDTVPPLPIGESLIGYATVQEAFEALVADPSAVQSEYEA